MKKILLRATVNPLANLSAYDMLTNNFTGNNSGNLLFPYSLMKSMLSDDVTVDTNNCYLYSDEEIDHINQEYDCYVIALANAFRTDFISNLKKLTKVIRRLTIPCVVVGTGMQDVYEPDFSAARPYDDAAKEFIAAVLEKSATLGVRGELTAAYVKHLGFSQVDVIGCPSMYMNGDNLSIRDASPLTAASRLSVNVSSGMPYPFLQLLNRTLPHYPDYHFVPQENKEFQLMYAGVPFPQRFPGQDLFPNDLSRPAYHEDHARFFTNVPSWLSYMQEIDFSFGTRIHGNIAAIQGGAPTFIFASDSRVRELATYHQIPFMPISEVNEATRLEDIYEHADFSSIQKGHAERMQHYIDFLDTNGVPHIPMDIWNADSSLFSQMVQKIDWEPALQAINCVSRDEQEKRLTLYWKYMTDKQEKMSKELAETKKELKEQKKNSASSSSGLSKILKRLRAH